MNRHLEPIKDSDTITFHVWHKGEKHYKKLIEKTSVETADEFLRDALFFQNNLK